MKNPLTASRTISKTCQDGAAMTLSHRPVELALDSDLAYYSGGTGSVPAGDAQSHAIGALSDSAVTTHSLPQTRANLHLRGGAGPEENDEDMGDIPMSDSNFLPLASSLAGSRQSPSSSPSYSPTTPPESTSITSLSPDRRPPLEHFALHLVRRSNNHLDAFSLGHLYLPPTWYLGFAHFSRDLLYDILDGTPDTSFGLIWHAVAKERGTLGIDATLGLLGFERSLKLLHTRAAWMGFHVQHIRIEYEIKRGYRSITLHDYVISFSHATCPRRHIRVCNGSERNTRILAAAIQVHLEMENAFKALTPPVTLAFRKWPLLVDDLPVQLGPQPELSNSSAHLAQGSYLLACEAILEEARTSSCSNPRFVALDVEDGDNACAIVQLAIRCNGVYRVILETSPFPTLRQVLNTPCTLLVFGDDDIAWLQTRGLNLSTVQLRNLQNLCLREDAKLQEDNRSWPFDRDYIDRRKRNISEALALCRCDPSCVYIKEFNGDAFHWPNGPGPLPSAWAARPLPTEYVKYAAADVVALFLINDVVSLEPPPSPPASPPASEYGDSDPADDLAYEGMLSMDTHRHPFAGASPPDDALEVSEEEDDTDSEELVGECMLVRVLDFTPENALNDIWRADWFEVDGARVSDIWEWLRLTPDRYELRYRETWDGVATETILLHPSDSIAYSIGKEPAQLLGWSISLRLHQRRWVDIDSSRSPVGSPPSPPCSPSPLRASPRASFADFAQQQQRSRTVVTRGRRSDCPEVQPFDGFFYCARSLLFNTLDAQVVLGQLRDIVCKSWHSFNAYNELPLACRLLSSTDVTWMKQCGSLDTADRLSLWEVTLAAPGLSSQALKILGSAASLQPPPSRVRTRHYHDIQSLSTRLADHILPHLCAIHDGDSSDLYHMATQVTRGVFGSTRGLHRDPGLIAEALATFSLVGTADITLQSLTTRRGTIPNHLFSCSPSTVYLLLNDAVRIDKHGVLVTSPYRFSITLRFGSRAKTQG